jgi:peptidoglycan/LPS O-acetylase OafA/YrhL
MHNRTLDFLRGIAVIGVVLFHIWPENFESGYLGVDLFFVLSGYLIAQNLTKNNNGISFFKNRFIRLGPLYFFTIFLILTSGLILGINLVEKNDGICSILAISNICYYQKNEYFNLFKQNDPLGHLWSISLEIQFYIISYLLMKYSKKLLIPIASISIIISTYKYNNETHNYYDLSTRLWEYLAGSILYIYAKKNLNIKYLSYRNLVSILIFIIYILIFTMAIKQNIFISFGFIAFTVLIISIFNINQLKCRLIEEISYISYASYLVHYPIIKYLNYYFGDNIYTNYYALITTFGLGYVLTYLYNKILSLFNNKFRLSIIICLVLSSACAYLILEKHGFAKFQNIKAIQAEMNLRNEHLKCSDGMYYDCYQTSNNEKKYLIIGDSHAMAIAVGSLLNYSSSKTDFKIISRGGCLPVVEYSFWNGNPDTKPRECEKFYNIISNEIKGDYKYIIFANYNSLFLNKWRAYNGNENNKEKSIGNKELYENITEQYVKIFKDIQISGKVPVYILDVPEYDTDLAQCEINEIKCKTPRIDVELSRSEEIKMKNLLASKYHFNTINLMDLLCDDKYCYAYRDGEWRYADGNHLNGKWGGKAFDFIELNIKGK